MVVLMASYEVKFDKLLFAEAVIADPRACAGPSLEQDFVSMSAIRILVGGPWFPFRHVGEVTHISLTVHYFVPYVEYPV